MLSYKLDFSSCAWKPGFVKSSHIYLLHVCIAKFDEENSVFVQLP